MPKKPRSPVATQAQLPNILYQPVEDQPRLVELSKNFTTDPFFYTEKGILYCTGAMDLLSAIPDDTVDVIFADPPYNINKADWDKFASMSEYVNWVQEWLEQCQRILKPEGSTYVMGFSEILAHISVMATDLFSSVRWVIWHYRNKPSLGKSDWVRSHEAILHLRKSSSSSFYIDYIREPYNKHTKKYPERAQGESSQYGNGKEHKWKPDMRGAKPRDVIDIPAISNGMKESTDHPTQKPEELLRRLLLAVTQPGDLVVDPFGGSGTTYVVSEQLKLNWLGCDLSEEYCKMAATRLAGVPDRPILYWVDQDRKRIMHRRKVRGG